MTTAGVTSSCQVLHKRNNRQQVHASAQPSRSTQALSYGPLKARSLFTSLALPASRSRRRVDHRPVWAAAADTGTGDSQRDAKDCGGAPVAYDGEGETAPHCIIQPELDVKGLSQFPIFESFGTGLWRDSKERLFPYYWSDLRDGLNMKVLASAGFLFIACLCTAATFGVGAAVITQGQIGPVEMILSTAVCGVIYALTCGQPVALTGFGGAHLAFTGSLFALSQLISVPFLPFYSWVGIWTTGLLVLMTVTSVSNLVLYFTRFTDETFSCLSSIIFIYEAIKNLSKPFLVPDADLGNACLSLLLGLLTTGTVFALQSLRKSGLFKKKMRETISDFAPTLGVVAGSCAAAYALTSFPEAVLPSLTLPDGITPTSGRPWLIDFWDCPVWARFFAAVPATMLSILLFMDQVITTRLVNTPDNSLKKPWGYHLDLAVIAAYTGACSMFGLPWMTAATVPSLSHARSLATINDDTGDVEGLVENRISPALIHILMGLALFVLRPLLTQIPLSVFMGLFLYLGLSAASNNKVFNRAILMFTDPELYQKKMTKKLRKIRPKKTARWNITMYTILQLACLATLWGLKSSKAGIMFPLMVVGLVPIRIFTSRFFSVSALRGLDDCDDPVAAGRLQYAKEVGILPNDALVVEEEIDEEEDEEDEEGAPVSNGVPMSTNGNGSGNVGAPSIQST